MAASGAALSAGDLVSVWLDGGWLSGVVAETSHATGEFLVDFDDEGEGKAWVGFGDRWRLVRALFAGAPAEEEEPLPTDATSLAEPAPGAPEADLDDSSTLLKARFMQLHAETAASDGCLPPTQHDQSPARAPHPITSNRRHGAEAEHLTRARFGALHALTLQRAGEG